MNRKLLASVAIGGLLAATAANSQQSSPAPQQAGKASGGEVSGQSLPEVIVTAQRVSENSQTTALALDVVTPDELQRQNVVRAEDLARTAPALFANSSGGPTTNFFVRGVGNNSVNAYSDPAIAFNYDGVYIGRPSSTSGLFYDLQRVEILKGPQGTLYGRNATAGAINVIPNRPEIGEYSGSVLAGYGNFDWLSFQGAANIPVGDRTALRLSGMLSQHDGFQSDGTGDQDEYGARAQYLFQPSDDVSLRLAADAFRQRGSSNSGYYLGAVNPTFGPTGFVGYDFVPSGFDPSQGVHDPASEAYLASRFNSQLGRAGATLSSRPFNENDYWGVTGEFNRTTDGGTLTIQPAYRRANLDYQFTNSQRGGYSKESDQQTSFEMRWSSAEGGPVDYLIGAIYFDEKIDATAIYNQLTLIPFQDFATQTTSYAGFGKITFHPTDRLSLTAGGRYTSDSKSFAGNATVYVPFCGDPAPPQDFCPNLPFTPLVYSAPELEAFYQSNGIPVTPVPLYVLPGFVAGTPFVLRAPMTIDSSLDSDKFTYRLATQFDFTSQSMIYASFETGYHAGGFSFARGLESFEPETIDAYTVGTKNRFFDSRLQLNAELFLWKYENQQFSQFGYDLGNPPTTVYLTRNIGDSTIKGVDIDLDFLATESTRLSAQVQYLDTNYDSFLYYVPDRGLPPITTCSYAPTTQTTSAGTVAVYAVDCSGKPAFNSPEWSVNLNAEQSIALGDLNLVLQAGTRYRSSSWTTADYPAWTEAEGGFMSNASVTLNSDNARWFVTAYALNIEDDRRLAGVFNNSAGSLAAAGSEAPRTFGVRFGKQF